jgi:hypothetical protein
MDSAAVRLVIIGFLVRTSDAKNSVLV